MYIHVRLRSKPRRKKGTIYKNSVSQEQRKSFSLQENARQFDKNDKKISQPRF